MLPYIRYNEPVPCILVGDHPDADNVEHMKQVWSLCQNLWGDIPDSLKSNAFDKTVCAYELEQIRKRLLGEWLADVCSNRIDRECKLVRFSKVCVPSFSTNG